MITEEKLGLLWPQPQSVVQKEGKPFILQDKLYVYVAAGPGNSMYLFVKSEIYGLLIKAHTRLSHWELYECYN